MRSPIVVAIAAATLALLPGKLRAQEIRFHGVPASATSVGPHGEPHGIPAGATSPTFDNPLASGSRRIFRTQPHWDPRVGRGIGFNDGRARHGRNRGIVPVYVPYAVPYYDYTTEPPVTEETAVEPEQPQPPARTIFERRPTYVRDDDLAADPRYGEHYLDAREALQRGNTTPAGADKQASARGNERAAPVQEPADLLPSTVLIFRDGHRQEVGNYAIVGQNLFDISGGHVMKKIPLAVLDVDATRKLNEENGVDFRLP